MAARIEPRFVPPTSVSGSGLSREHVYGKVRPMQDESDGLPAGEGRWVLALLIGLAALAALAAAALP